MNKKVIGLMILAVFFLALTLSGAQIETEWTVTVRKDEMTGEETRYVLSPLVPPVSPVGLRYRSIKAGLGVGYDGEDEWVYIWFNQIPIFDDTEFKDDYEIINTKIKWNKKVEDVQLYREWASDVIYFLDSENVVSKIMNSDMMLLELNLDGERVYFQFPLEGAHKAINELYKKFPREEEKKSGSLWTVNVSKDIMTGEETWYASLPEVPPVSPVGLLYQGIKAVLGVGYDREDEWVYIQFNFPPILDDTEFKGDYKIINTRIKWDDEIEGVQLYHVGLVSDVIYFLDNKNVVSKIINSDTMLLELTMDSEKVYFQFPLEGANEAINELYKKFPSEVEE